MTGLSAIEKSGHHQTVCLVWKKMRRYHDWIASADFFHGAFLFATTNELKEELDFLWSVSLEMRGGNQKTRVETHQQITRWELINYDYRQQ